MQNQYMATYTPTSFVVKLDDSCTYFFRGATMNTVSSDGLYKMVYDSSKGPSCPADGSTSCYGGYWVTASATGVLAFADTSDSPCPAFFAVADDGSNQQQGTFTIAGYAVQKSTSWAPPGYSGSYDAAQGTVSISTPGCSVDYKLDPGLPPATLSFSSAAPPQGGSATLDYVGVSSQSCPTACASSGYNVAWDATGDRLSFEFNIVSNGVSWFSCHMNRRDRKLKFSVLQARSPSRQRMLPPLTTVRPTSA